MVGASGWGIGSDIIGRRWAFNLTLLIAGVFGTIAGVSTSFSMVAAMDALWSVGVGGNLPVDSAVFLEFLPVSHQYLLTVMSVWWSVGQVSMFFKAPCIRVANKGSCKCGCLAFGGKFLMLICRRVQKRRQHGVALFALRDGRVDTVDVHPALLRFRPLRISQASGRARGGHSCMSCSRKTGSLQRLANHILSL